MKRYTRQQIQEAIEYWKSVLKRMDESAHDLLSLLAGRYGNNLVLSDDRSFNLGDSAAYDLFKIFNDNIFGSRLPRTEILCGSYDEIAAELERRKASVPPDGFYGMFNIIAEDEELKSLDDRLRYRDGLIVINTDMINNSNFIFACSSLCHEMIHCYGKTFGEEPLCDKYWLLYRVKIDTHTTPTFVKMKRKANDMGLTIIDDSAGFDFSELNSEAFRNMMNSVISDGVNMDENETADKAVASKKIPGVGTSISHIDYL